MSAYVQGLTNANAIFDGVDSGSVTALASLFDDVLVTTAVLTTADVSLAIAHGLSGTPDFVLQSVTPGAAGAAEGIGWSATATTLTLTKVDTQAIQTMSVFAAVLG